MLFVPTTTSWFLNLNLFPTVSKTFQRQTDSNGLIRFLWKENEIANTSKKDLSNAAVLFWKTDQSKDFKIWALKLEKHGQRIHWMIFVIWQKCQNSEVVVAWFFLDHYLHIGYLLLFFITTFPGYLYTSGYFQFIEHNWSTPNVSILHL